MNKHIATLARLVQEGNGWEQDGEKITVSKTSRTAGSAYERVRNAVEYEEEHLLRRNAIRRILGRRRTMDSDEAIQSRGEAILRELIWAKYLPNKIVPAKKIKAVDAILNKYDSLFERVPDNKEHQEMEDWLLDVLSTEVEYTIESPKSSEALATMMFEAMRAHITWGVGTDLDESKKDLLTYIAIHRALLKSNLATLRFRVFMLYVPDWHRPSAKTKRAVEERLMGLIQTIENDIRHPYADQLYRLMRRYALVFWAMEDVIKEHPDEAMEIFRDDDRLKRSIGTAVSERYKVFRKKLYRIVGRAIIFLFLTKMLLALILEVPYDLYVLGALETVPLAINVVFHPVFLALIGLTVRIPAGRNTALVTDHVRKLVNDESASMETIFKVKKPWTQGTLGAVFSSLYGLTFIVSYGVVAWVLTAVLNFNVLSTALFLFFFSLVTFFGIKIRQSVRELLVVERQGGIIGTIFDFFMLPVVRVGRWISLQSPKVNIFIFFLDFIVEAPFKLAIEMIEGWVAFIREKKEEL
ncbi:hypothetical protein A3I45_01930 [Candidatus Uhrbacteria bacterium RIFCSPLOWO2_02_FULL_53_10]|uniref:Uncharacterized protein n=1 Tax=Candidatus Uhrbacteria bacterium RIFCSPLOWO2_02_FULL_53_10 TaxID=1802411 RepID=A0A1F7VED2_9BACT|nr:MAG: hypothetical protein A3I45_01930 [Candidatus Uhrbacteria bacterium RIFCSPLOWO2_02_FULL_53_10]